MQKQVRPSRVERGCLVLLAELRTADMFRNDVEIREYLIIHPSMEGEGRLSESSPLGRALLGREAGARLAVETENGRRTVWLLGVDQPEGSRL